MMKLRVALGDLKLHRRCRSRLASHVVGNSSQRVLTCRDIKGFEISPIMVTGGIFSQTVRSKLFCANALAVKNKADLVDKPVCVERFLATIGKDNSMDTEAIPEP